MIETNDYQIGGNHYKRDYQHWDFVIDINCHYLPACATKYISRWRDKNGVEDLRKALHYIAKAEDIYLYQQHTSKDKININRFTNQYEDMDKDILRCIMYDEYDNAREMIEFLIKQHSDLEFEPDSNYTNQDPDLKEIKL